MAIDSAAAQDALWIQFTQDATESGSLAPPLDPRMDRMQLLGHVIGTDKVLNNEQTVCYGFLVEEVDGTCIVLIRGTASNLEWAEDGEFAQINHPNGGKVEAGFYGLYNRMSYVPFGGTKKPLPIGIAGAIGNGPVRVVGHSLGAALATYLALDLALAFGDRISACILASPRPGNGEFASIFHATVKNYKSYQYALDLVPRVPLGFNYLNLPGTIEIDPDNACARIKSGLWCQHHVIDYAAMLDYSLTDWEKMSSSVCILGPNQHI